MEATRIAVAKERRDDPMIHLELGILAYRIGEMTAGTKHYDDAAGEFGWEIDDIGFFRPAMTAVGGMEAGDVGYLITGIKDVTKLRVGSVLPP